MSINPSEPANVSAETFWSDISTLSETELGQEIRGLASYTAAAMCRMLLLIAEFERRGAWHVWGIQSCAHWLSWQCGFSPNTAREHVRVARVLVDLPHTVSLFQKGELSFAKVRAITRVATRENEELLVSYAKEVTAAQLERIVRGFRDATETDKANQAHADRSVEWKSKGNGLFAVTIECTAEQMAIMRKAEAKAMEDVSAETSEQGRKADAYLAMAETVLASGTKRPKDRYLVNLSVSAETLTEDADGECTVDDLDVPAETARRLSCDAPVVVSLLNKDGVTIKMGRKSRLFKGGSRAAVMKRNRGCCIFPGCNNRKWIDVHHIKHWTKGGETNPENGAVLCDFHHRLVHEGGFTLDHTFTFRTPTGVVVSKTGEIPPPMNLDQLLKPINQNACLSAGNGAPFDLYMTVSNLLN